MPEVLPSYAGLPEAGHWIDWSNWAPFFLGSRVQNGAQVENVFGVWA